MCVSYILKLGCYKNNVGFIHGSQGWLCLNCGYSVLQFWALGLSRATICDSVFSSIERTLPGEILCWSIKLMHMKSLRSGSGTRRQLYSMCPSFISAAGIKCPDKKQHRGAGGLFQFIMPGNSSSLWGSQGRKFKQLLTAWLKSRTWRNGSIQAH